MKTYYLLLSVWAALGGLASTAGAAPYWHTYEGNDLPENEGWTRYWGNQDGEYQGDGAIRTLDDGVLTMDSLYDPWVWDWAYIERPGQMDPDPGETLVMEWRLLVEEVLGRVDPGVSLASDERWLAGFAYNEDYIWSIYEEDVTIPITSGVFHDYHFTSSDMRTYELYIDGTLAREGVFSPLASQSEVIWGDLGKPLASRAQWDYFRVGVVPEPTSLVMVLAVVLWRHRMPIGY